jgi:hypothetical protein
LRRYSGGQSHGLRSEGRDLRGEALELGMPTLEERRHQGDMVQTFKIVEGIDRVQASIWFQFATEGGRATRARIFKRLWSPRIESKE